MRTRIISGAVLTVILLIAVFTGRYGMFILSLAASAIGMFELYRVVGIHKSKLGITGYVLCAIYYAITWFDAMQFIFPFMVISGLIFMFIFVLVYSHRSAEQAGFGLLGLYYVAIPLSFLYRISVHSYDGKNYGFYILPILIISTWGADVFAYFIGSAFGKHKLAPKISPKKSVEGAVGGIAVSTLLGFGYGMILGYYVGIQGLGLAFALFCLIGSIMSIFGDLSASAIKRRYEIKDYGKIIPGHGGVLDRFDSMIFVAPCIYFVAVFLIPIMCQLR